VKTWLLLLSLFFSQSVLSADQKPQESPDELVNRYRWRIDQTLRDVKKIDPGCQECGLFIAGTEETTTPECRDTYKKLYKIPDSVAKEKKGDRYAMTALMEQLNSPCESNQFACGFRENPDDAGDFRKRISIMGPDGKSRTRVVHISLRSSSVTPDEKLNRTSSKDDQDSQTDATRDFYLDGLENADVSLYVGHARDGGGPDFGPPVVNPKLHHTDFDWYHKNHPGVDAIAEALDGAPKTAKVIGIFACWANDHFHDFLRKAAPNAGLVLSGQAEFEAITAQAAATLDSLLGLRCEKDFKSSVNVIKRLDTTSSDYEIGPVNVDGVFK
jgi:hypothetical protein